MRALLLFLPACLLAAPAVCATTLDIQSGLWERVTTVTVEGGAEPHGLNLERLTPEQRARIEQRLAERSQPTTRKTLQCVTPAQVQEWSSFEAHERETPDCKRTFTEQSPRHVKYTASCDGGRTTGEFEFTVSAADRVEARMYVIERSDAGERKIRTVWQGRWLAASCGNVAPGKTQRVN